MGLASGGGQVAENGFHPDHGELPAVQHSWVQAARMDIPPPHPPPQGSALALAST